MAGGLHDHAGRHRTRKPQIVSSISGDHVCPRCKLFIADATVDSAFICSCVPRGAITQEHIDTGHRLTIALAQAAGGSEAAEERARAYVLELALAMGVEAW